MTVTETPLKDCFILQPEIFKDSRGIFYEAYQKRRFNEALGKNIDFVQNNHSVSKKGVLRGLHFQTGGHAQSKLIHVVKGEVLDVILDLREGSETFGQHFKLKLSDKNKKQIFIPKGMAHGFLTLSEEAIFCYKCDAYYYEPSEAGIIYNDKTLHIDWEYPADQIILSQKDKVLPTFKALYP